MQLTTFTTYSLRVLIPVASLVKIVHQLCSAVNPRTVYPRHRLRMLLAVQP